MRKTQPDLPQELFSYAAAELVLAQTTQRTRSLIIGTTLARGPCAVKDRYALM